MGGLLRSGLVGERTNAFFATKLRLSIPPTPRRAPNDSVSAKQPDHTASMARTCVSFHHKFRCI